jgi:hypothetical protein
VARNPADAIDLRLLRQFVAAAEELHFHRAARRLAMSQPPLTAAIRRLEAEIGATLIERGNRTVALTAAGGAPLGEARALLARANRAVLVARGAPAGPIGSVRLGYVGSAMYGRLPAAIRSFRRSRPEVRLELREATTVAQLAGPRSRRRCPRASVSSCSTSSSMKPWIRPRSPALRSSAPKRVEPGRPGGQRRLLRLGRAILVHGVVPAGARTPVMAP